MIAVDIIYQLLRVLGALGLFLFGMKLMSESLQRVAGSRLKSIVNAMIANKFKAVLSGLIVTAIIQASSATTVMMVSFVNAGLLSLTESIGVMMGANIGTTIKLWFIVGLGLKFNLSLILLPLIGLSLPLLFTRNGLRKSWGEFIMGFALLFLGIEFLISIIPDIQNNTNLLDFLHTFPNNNFLSILLFVLFGLLLTVSIQSSSAMITFTIIMSLNGLLSYENAAAMILGENIGTTVTANIAAIIANNSAKKAALAHTLFNISGAIWILIVFYPFLHLIDWVVFSIWGVSPSVNSNYIPIALCFFHTSFNVINTLLWISFIPLMVKILHFILPEKRKKEKFQLKNIHSGLLSTSEFSFELIQKELCLLTKMNLEMFEIIPRLLLEKEEKKYKKLELKINKLDLKLNKKIQGITLFLISLSQNDLSEKTAIQITNIYRFIDGFENIKSIYLQMADIIESKNNSKIWFTQRIREQIYTAFALVSKTFNCLILNLESDNEIYSLTHIEEIEEQLKFLQNQNDFEKDYEDASLHISVEAINIYTQLFTNCEKIIDSTKKINLLIIS